MPRIFAISTPLRRALAAAATISLTAASLLAATAEGRPAPSPVAAARVSQASGVPGPARAGLPQRRDLLTLRGPCS
jgi:hypothetical protein